MHAAPTTPPPHGPDGQLNIDPFLEPRSCIYGLSQRLINLVDFLTDHLNLEAMDRAGE